MTALSSFVDLPVEEKEARGLVFTPAEIAQQPRTWQRTLGIFEENAARIAAFLDAAGVRDEGTERPAVFLIGAGTSDYAGRGLELLLRQSWGCEVSAVASTDLLLGLEEYAVPGRRYLWISISRSGDSPEGVAVLERALERYPEIAQMVITCNAVARMAAVCEGAKKACAIVLDDAVNDRSLAMTSSLTNMIVMGQCLAHAWSIASYKPIHAALVGSGPAASGKRGAEGRGGCEARVCACPNVLVDISARASELGRQPYSARRFFLRYADRILFGADLVPEIEMYRLYYRFLETDDEYF